MTLDNLIEELERLEKRFQKVVLSIAHYVPEAMPDLSFPRVDVEIDQRYVAGGEPGRAFLDPGDLEAIARHLPATLSALKENKKLREALAVPEVWSQMERDGMAAAFDKADGKHGHYETLFAVAAWLLRHRAAALQPQGDAKP